LAAGACPAGAQQLRLLAGTLELCLGLGKVPLRGLQIALRARVDVEQLLLPPEVLLCGNGIRLSLLQSENALPTSGDSMTARVSPFFTR
jgi:hypothetical protein